jgi:hypothetical protein
MPSAQGGGDFYPMPILLHPVRTEADKRAFYKFSFRVYRNDPNWVPPLWPEKKAYLDKKAAFFSYGEGDFWLAKDGNEIVGTLGTAIDHARNRGMNWKAGLFGFFEVLPERYAVARSMWDFACDWSRQRGMNELQGPYSFSGEDDYGFLVDGFHTAPSVLMGHTPRYYSEFADRYGLQRLYENVAYRVDLAGNASDMERLPVAITRIADRARARHGLGRGSRKTLARVQHVAGCSARVFTDGVIRVPRTVRRSERDH